MLNWYKTFLHMQTDKKPIKDPWILDNNDPIQRKLMARINQVSASMEDYLYPHKKFDVFALNLINALDDFEKNLIHKITKILKLNSVKIEKSTFHHPV